MLFNNNKLMDNICRTCTRVSNNLQHIFDEKFHLPYKITTISGVEVTEGDDLPSTVCKECVKNINVLYNFRKVIINSDLDLKERSVALKKTVRSSEFVECAVSESIEVQAEEQDEVILKTEIEACTPNVNRTISCRSLKSLMNYKQRTYSCKICDFTCTERTVLNKHNRANHDLRKVCNVCGKFFHSDNLKKHIDSHTDPPVDCPECGKTLKNQQSLRSHSYAHRDLEYVCEVCGKSYKHRGEFNRHTACHDANRPKKVKCPMCDKMFYNTKHIKQHIQSHTGVRPYICKLCDKRFTSNYGLKVHERLHTNEKPFVCEFCSLAFRQKCTLLNHIKLKHEAVNL